MIAYNKKIIVKCKEKSEDYKTKQNNYLSIYTNFKEYTIDRLQLRKQPKKDRLFFTSSNGRKCKSMHIILDKNDLSKSYKTMQLLSNYSNEQPCYYYLDTKMGIVRKLKEVVSYYKKHGLTIDSELVYHGKKSQAIKKLEKLMA